VAVVGIEVYRPPVTFAYKTSESRSASLGQQTVPSSECTLAWPKSAGSRNGSNTPVNCAPCSCSEHGVDWHEALALAAETRCERPFFLGLLLAHELLDTVVSEAILDRARADPIVLSTARETAQRLRRVPRSSRPARREPPTTRGWRYEPWTKSRTGPQCSKCRRRSI
jgi:hypothetical protein